MTERERQIRRADRWRIGAILALCLVVAVPVMVAVAGSPDRSGLGSVGEAVAPAASANPGASTKPDASGSPDKAPRRDHGDKGFGFGGRFGGRLGGGSGRGAVTITAIDGSKISLKTDDGWTRTITVTADTIVRKGRVAAKLSDLSIGDAIRFSQQRNADGTYAITGITIPTQRAAGEVTAIDGNTITITRRNGESQAITVTGTTTFRLGFVAGSKSDVKVGSRVIAQGDVDGTSFTATSVAVQLTVVTGEVTKVAADSITVKGRHDQTVVIHLTAKTAFRVLGKQDATAADIKVGDWVVAAGVARANGSIDAQGVGSGKARWLRDFRGLKEPKPTATPEA